MGNFLALEVGNYLAPPLGNSLALEALRLGNYLALDKGVKTLTPARALIAEMVRRYSALDEGRSGLERFCREVRKPTTGVPSPFNHVIRPDPDQLLRASRSPIWCTVG